MYVECCGACTKYAPLHYVYGRSHCGTHAKGDKTDSNVENGVVEIVTYCSAHEPVLPIKHWMKVGTLKMLELRVALMFYGI